MLILTLLIMTILTTLNKSDIKMGVFLRILIHVLFLVNEDLSPSK